MIEEDADEDNFKKSEEEVMEEEDHLLKWVKEHIKEKGHITVEDIKKMIEKYMHKKFGKVLKHELKMIMKDVKVGFKRCDENGDHKVTGKEFDKCMKGME